MLARLPVGLLVAAVLLLILPQLPVPSFVITLMNNIGLASLVAIGLVLLTGVGGLTSFGQAAFCGFGAYTTAVLTTAYDLSPWAALPLALFVGAGAALPLGLITVRLSGHYLPLGTLAWGIALYYLFDAREASEHGLRVGAEIARQMVEEARAPVVGQRVDARNDARGNRRTVGFAAFRQQPAAFRQQAAQRVVVPHHHGLGLQLSQHGEPPCAPAARCAALRAAAAP